MITPAIQVTNVSKLHPWLYSVSFVLNFVPVDMYYETSLDGVSWSMPIPFSTFTSPKKIIIQTSSNFSVRLSSTVIPKIHSSTFNNTFN